MMRRDGNKPLVWLHGAVKTPPFSAEARIEAGVLLRRLQRGERLGLPRSRPMPVIAAGCHELRNPDASSSWRVVYCIDQEAIVILEVFAKRTRQTPSLVIEVCRSRLDAYRRAIRKDRP